MPTRPHVLRFNHYFCREKIRVLTQRMGLCSGADLPAAFTDLNARLGLPLRLRDLGLTQPELEPLAEHALHDHCSPTNPRPLDLEACRALYREAWKGY